MNIRRFATKTGVAMFTLVGAVTWSGLHYTATKNLYTHLAGNHTYRQQVELYQPIREMPHQIQELRHEVELLSKEYSQPAAHETHAPLETRTIDHRISPQPSPATFAPQLRAPIPPKTTLAPLHRTVLQSNSTIKRKGAIERRDQHAGTSYSPKKDLRNNAAATNAKQRTESRAEPAVHTASASTIDTLLQYNKIIPIKEDPGRITHWNKTKDHAWYSIARAPGKRVHGMWEMPATLQSAQEYDTIRFQLNTTVPNRDITFRLLFTENNRIVSSAYCRPGVENELIVGKGLYRGPIQYELVKGSAIHKGKVKLDVLASGKNLVFKPAYAPTREEHERSTAVSQNNARSVLLEQHSQQGQYAQNQSLRTYHNTPHHELVALHQRISEYLTFGTLTRYEQDVHQKLLPEIQKAILARRFDDSGSAQKVRHA